MSDSIYLSKAKEDIQSARETLAYVRYHKENNNPVAALASLSTTLRILTHAKSWFDLHNKYASREEESK